MTWLLVALAWAFAAVTVVLAVRAQRAARQVRWQAERARMSHELREAVFAGLPPLPEQPMRVLVEGEACDDRPGVSEGEWIENRRLCDPDPIRYWRPADVND